MFWHIYALEVIVDVGKIFRKFFLIVMHCFYLAIIGAFSIITSLRLRVLLMLPKRVNRGLSKFSIKLMISSL